MIPRSGCRRHIKLPFSTLGHFRSCWGNYRDMDQNTIPMPQTPFTAGESSSEHCICAQADRAGRQASGSAPHQQPGHSQAPAWVTTAAQLGAEGESNHGGATAPSSGYFVNGHNMSEPGSGTMSSVPSLNYPRRKKGCQAVTPGPEAGAWRRTPSVQACNTLQGWPGICPGGRSEIPFQLWKTS